MTIGILNPDGSHAEMSGNGTRIAAAWLMSQTGSDVARVRVGEREVEVRRVGDGQYESAMGVVEVSPAEVVAGVELTPVSVGNPHAVVVGDPDRHRRARAAPRDAPALPGPDERAGRARRPAGRSDGSGLGARRGGDLRVGNERRRGRRGDTRRPERCSCTSREAISACGSRRSRVADRAGRTAHGELGLRL